MNTYEEMVNELDKFLNGSILKQISEDAPGLVHLFKNVGSAIVRKINNINNREPSTLDDLLADFEKNKEKYKKEWKPSVNMRVHEFNDNIFLHQIQVYLNDRACTIFSLKGLRLHLNHFIDHEEAKKALDLLSQNLNGFSFDVDEIYFY